MAEEKTVAKDFLGIRAKREALGLTIKDVISITRISAVNLEAIENGDFQALSVPLYARNFIRTYARTLGLDSKPILDSYEAYLQALKDAEAQKTPETVQKKQTLLAKPRRYKVYAGVAVVVIIAAAAGFFFFRQPPPAPEVAGGQQSATAAVPNAPVNESLNPAEPAPSVAAEVKEQTPLNPVLPQQKSEPQAVVVAQQNVSGREDTRPAAMSEGADVLVIKAVEETWIRMKIDQNPPQEALLQPGDEIKRRGIHFEIDIGNAGGITLMFKGKSMESLGKSGQVVHLRLP